MGMYSLLGNESPKLISVDAGKFRLKSVTKNDDSGFKKFSARAKIEETRELKASGGSYVVEVNGVKYLFGEEASEVDYDTNKKREVHRVAMYLAIANLIGDSKCVNVMLGCPLTSFLNKDFRDEYREYMLSNKVVNVSVNGRRKEFVINDITVVPESIGHIYQSPSRYKNEMVAIIDIGGLNSNGAIYQNRKPMKSSIFTVNEGGLILFNKIKKQLNSKYNNLNCQDYEIEYMLKKGFHIGGERVEEGDKIIEEIMYAQVDGIIKEAKKNNWNLQMLDIVCIGGGSELLRKYIGDRLPQANVPEGCMWDNAMGFYKMGEVVYGKQK